MSDPNIRISERVIAKIKKLLALSASPNEHEAAAAAAKAQALLFRYRLRMQDVDLLADPTTASGVSGNPVREAVFGETEGSAAHWQLRLATAVAKTSMCVPISQRFRTLGSDGRFHDRERFVFVGRPVDIELAKLSLNFLTEALLAAAAHYQDEERERRETNRARRSYRSHGYDEGSYARGLAGLSSSYLDGAAAAVAIRLTALFEARRDAGENSKALVVRREAEIEDYLSRRHEQKGRSGEMPSRPLHREAHRPTEYERARSSAYEEGFSDGQSMMVAPPLERLSAQSGTRVPTRPSPEELRVAQEGEDETGNA